MLTITRVTRAASCNGFITITIWVVEQLGLAMIPLWVAIASGFTSGITSGTSGFIR